MGDGESKRRREKEREKERREGEGEEESEKEIERGMEGESESGLWTSLSLHYGSLDLQRLCCNFYNWAGNVSHVQHQI